MTSLPPITSETQWKPAKGFESLYAVSDAGHVINIMGWCNPQVDGRTTRHLGELLSPQPDKYGYLRYWINHKPGYRCTYAAHRLVFESFVGEIPKGLEIDHKDDRHSNNRVSNLQLLTRKQNVQKSFRQGRRENQVRRGSDSPHAKITEDDVKRIFKLAAKGVTQREIAEIYNLSHIAVGYILRGKTWKHVSGKIKKPTTVRNHHRGKLTERDVIRIRQLANSGVSQKMIADYYGLSQGYVSGVINRRFWSELNHQLPLL